MARKSNRPQLLVDEKTLNMLKKTVASRTAESKEIERAKILISYSERMNISHIQKEFHISRPTIYKCIDKALGMGVEAGLKDQYHRPKEPIITKEAKAWVLNIAYNKPTSYGYATKIWSRRSLAIHARKYGPLEGHTCLSNAAKATIQRILSEHPIRPHTIAYYVERVDPDFEKAKQTILMMYKEVSLTKGKLQIGEAPDKITVSVDEKHDVQLTRNVTPDILPNLEDNSKITRDYENQQIGTVSILVALDLNTGHIIGQVHERYRSREFVLLLKEIDDYYPKGNYIRVILDNHSAHNSKEMSSYLATKPNRFMYIHIPKHGTWLNVVEMLFGNMATTFCQHIRVNDITELKNRILFWFNEVNNAPVVFRWKKSDLEIQ
jgi:transposase